MRDNNGIPVYLWCQASLKLIPKVCGDDPPDEYITLYCELVLRSPTIKETHHGQHGQKINTLKEMRSSRMDEFKAANPILWEQLFQMMGKTTVWEHAKNTQRLKNGRKAYRTILFALFGDKIVFFRSERQKKDITALTYKGGSWNFSWVDYVNCHLNFHNQRAFLEIRAEEMGHDVSPWSKYEKIGHLLNGISDVILDASNNAIISDPNGLRSNFAKCSRCISDFLESTDTSNSGNNRNISEASGDSNGRNRNGQGRGNGSPHGSRGGRGKS